MNAISAAEVDRIATEQAARMVDCLALAHAEALEMERDRLQGCADRHLLDSRPADYLTIRADVIDGEYEVMELDNEEIVEFGREYGLDLPELVARLRFFIEWAQDEQ